MRQKNPQLGMTERMALDKPQGKGIGSRAQGRWRGWGWGRGVGMQWEGLQAIPDKPDWEVSQ